MISSEFCILICLIILLQQFSEGEENTKSFVLLHDYTTNANEWSVERSMGKLAHA